MSYIAAMLTMHAEMGPGDAETLSRLEEVLSDDADVLSGEADEQTDGAEALINYE